MTSTETETATLSVDGISAMSDAELAQFMKKHRRPEGGYELPVHGWDKLSKDERNHLAERLKAQERSLAQSITACSRPLDLNDLDARLRQLPSENNVSLRLGPRTIDSPESSTPPFDLEADRRKHEWTFYHDLVNDGGHPVYPIDLLEDVLTQPSKYTDILRPWQEHPDNTSPEGIFMRQSLRWQDFRKWQNDNRGLEDDDGGFPAYVERRKYGIKENYRKERGEKFLAEIDADPSCLKSEWDQIQLLRRRQRRLFREHGCRGFCDYVEAVNRRLTRHNFTQPFELDEDPKKQDKLTTWIEYLNYECWWLDKYASDIERLEPEHDKLWQELVDKKVLKPHETKEFVRTVASGMETEAEQDQAMKAVQRAESRAKRIYVLTQEDPKRLRIPRAKRISMLEDGTEKLLAAKRRLEQARNRSFLIVEFVRATFGYSGAKRDAARQRILVQWALEQVSVIEAEMAEYRAKQAEPDQIKRTKRRLPTDEEPLEKRSLKKPKLDQQKSGSSTSNSPWDPSRSVTDQETTRGSQTDNSATRRSRQSMDNAWVLSQELCRSTHITAR